MFENMEYVDAMNVAYACFICGEEIPFSSRERVCSECKAAVLKMREQVKEGGEE